MEQLSKKDIVFDEKLQNEIQKIQSTRKQNELMLEHSEKDIQSKRKVLNNEIFVIIIRCGFVVILFLSIMIYSITKTMGIDTISCVIITITTMVGGFTPFVLLWMHVNKDKVIGYMHFIFDCFSSICITTFCTGWCFLCCEHCELSSLRCYKNTNKIKKKVIISSENGEEIEMKELSQFQNKHKKTVISGYKMKHDDSVMEFIANNNNPEKPTPKQSSQNIIKRQNNAHESRKGKEKIGFIDLSL